MVWFLSWAPDVFLPLLPEAGPTRHVGSSFIEGLTAELAVPNMVLEKGAWRAACVQHLLSLC